MNRMEIRSLSKQYRLGEVGTGTLSHDLNRWWHKIRGKDDPYALVGQTNDRTQAGTSDYVWALKDINLDVAEGDVLGIVGRNGAGKSTLLKLISQITSPTTGTIKTKGRVASLLEVGTGMNPQLTARENIYLNGAILGMRKSEITAKLDEIVEFSGCRLYIDTPLKRFSSGMRVRLGFAVAAFLEPDIFIVDEVLAVGDAEFQKKALGKMKDVSRSSGRTILFVSHNMAAVKSLCSRAILLENGQLTYTGTADEVVSKYLGGATDLLNYRKNVHAAHGFTIHEMGIKAEGKDYSEPFSRIDRLSFVMHCDNQTAYDYLHITLKFKGEDGMYFLTTSSADSGLVIKTGSQKLEMAIPPGFFNEGSFFVDVLVVAERKTSFIILDDCLNFLLTPEPKPLGAWMGVEYGYVRQAFDWSVK